MSSAMKHTASELMYAAKVIASERRPYFAPGLFSMPLHERPGLGTFACDKYWRLYYDPEILGKLPAHEIAGAITHELYHCILDHHARFDAIADGADLQRANLAGDLAINPGLVGDVDRRGQALTPLPHWAVFPKDFGLEDNLSMEAYYELLPKDGSQPQPGKGKGKGKGKGSGKSAPEVGNPSHMPSGGKCGSCAGGPPQSYEEPAPDKGGKEGVTSEVGELIRQKIATEVIRFNAESTARGTVPAGLLRWAESFITPKVNWMAWMRCLLANAFQTAERGREDWSYRTPSRRQQAYGRFVRPGMVSPKVRVGFIVDTSGSMSDQMLERCHAEIKGFMQQIQSKADMWLLSVDAAAYGIEKIENISQVKFKGGGGTDMRIGFDAFDQIRPRMDLVACLSDCHTPWPEHKPHGTIAIVRVGSGSVPTWPCRSVTIQENE